jgi:uncharacterized repeat protein (TIGR03847 family)
MSASFSFDEPELFTAGTVGPKGQRVFYLQFGNPGSLTALKLEKGQVNALAEFLDQLLEDAGPVDPDDVPLALDLVEPIDSAWTVSSIGVGFEEEAQQFLLVAEELIDDDEADLDPATAQLRLSPGQVQAFIEHARDIVSSGRPPCSYCGRPLDDDDDWCPCFN